MATSLRDGDYRTFMTTAAAQNACSHGATRWRAVAIIGEGTNPRPSSCRGRCFAAAQGARCTLDEFLFHQQPEDRRCDGHGKGVMSESVPTHVLSEALQEKISGRRVVAAVFTTFRFEPGFFEQEVLPVLFDQSFSHAEKVRLVQLEELVRQIDHVAVYYDRRGLMASGAPPSLDVQRIPTTRNGYFHPKLILLLVKNEEDDGSAESLIVGVTSANLTRAGWWENVECAWVEEVADGDQCAFRKDLLSIFSSIRDDERTGDEHVELDRIYKFMRYRVRDAVRRSKRGVLRPRLFGGQTTAPEVSRRNTSACRPTPTISKSSRPISTGRTTQARCEVSWRPWLRRKHAYSFQKRTMAPRFVVPAFSRPSHRCQRFNGGDCRGNCLRRGKGAEDKQTPRFVHAKVYRLWSRSEGQRVLPHRIGQSHACGTQSRQRRKPRGRYAVRGRRPGPPSVLVGPAGCVTPYRFDPRSRPTRRRRSKSHRSRFAIIWNQQRGQYFWEDDAPPRRLVFSSFGSELPPLDQVEGG